jgi:antirestriction protein ArdC
MFTEIVLKDLGFCNRNFISKRFYLWIKNQRTLREAGFTTPEWLTYHQAKQNWLRIKPGAKGIVVEFKDQVQIEERTGDKIEKKTVPYLRYHTVFNVEQTEPVKST